MNLNVNLNAHTDITTQKNAICPHPNLSSAGGGIKIAIFDKATLQHWLTTTESKTKGEDQVVKIRQALHSDLFLPVYF